MDRIKLLCDISELNHLFRDSVSVEGFLHRTVKMVTEHLKTEVCSIYLYDDEDGTLVMRATEGLNPESVDHVSMKVGEGLTGKALKEMRPVCVSKASRNPNYRLFVGTDEEQYDNFLAVPITRGLAKIGVLVLQRKKKRKFQEEDVLACKAVASQLANIIENARFLMSMHNPHEEKKVVTGGIPEGLEFVRGKAASEGYCYSMSRFVDKDMNFASLSETQFEDHYELEDFDRAVKATEDQLEELQGRVEEKLSDAASLIFASHLLILKDHEFVGAMARLIEKGQSPPQAMLRIARQYIDAFTVSKNKYVREKVQDVEDLIVRLIGNLVSGSEQFEDYADRVVIARDLFPSDLLRMSSENVGAIVLVAGGVTSHLSILARSLQIPMVIANVPDLLKVPDGTNVLVDAEAGNVYVNPSIDVVEGFEKRNEARVSVEDRKSAMKDQTHTADGTKVRLLANINLLSDIAHAQELKCEGVGLYRTEFPFIIRNNFPSEEEQYVTYRKLIEKMDGKPVTFRTLDIGGDKVLSYYSNARELNPSMGMRSIRFSLQNKRIFVQQLCAMLRAGAGVELRIMFPMISSLDDFLSAGDVLCECIEDLDVEGIEHNDNPKTGIMVELPSVVHTARDLAREVDFFSIGTNDFIQFMLGVDRTNENVECFYVPHHPAVLRGIKCVVEAAAEYDRDVSICGDMAHQAYYTELLLGLGIRTLSVDPGYLPRMQEKILGVDILKATQLAKTVLAQQSTVEIAKILGIRKII